MTTSKKTMKLIYYLVGLNIWKGDLYFLGGIQKAKKMGKKGNHQLQKRQNKVYKK